MSYVPSLLSPLVDKLGKVIPPWNSFFQQFTQNASAPVTANSPFTPNTQGNLIFSGGNPAITLTRGSLNLNLTGQTIIPLAIGDTISWSGATTAYFLGTFLK